MGNILNGSRVGHGPEMTRGSIYISTHIALSDFMMLVVKSSSLKNNWPIPFFHWSYQSLQLNKDNKNHKNKKYKITFDIQRYFLAKKEKKWTSLFLPLLVFILVELLWIKKQILSIRFVIIVSIKLIISIILSAIALHIITSFYFSIIMFFFTYSCAVF